VSDRTPPADAPLPYGITTRGFIVSGDRTREPLAEVIHDAACSYLVTAVNALPALLADHARLTAEVARLTAEVEGLTAERDHYRVALHAHEARRE
jgi:hypothetical protein